MALLARPNIGEKMDVTAEKKSVLMCEPHLIAFMEIMDHVDGGKETPGGIAATDGRTTWYGPDYRALPMPERNFIFVHELFHGIFRHPDRAMMKRLLTGVLKPSFWNIAGDAIINEAIVSNPAMPSGMFRKPTTFPGVFMKYIHEMVTEAVAFSGKKAPSNYDPKAKAGMQIEILYDWLMWALDAVNQSREEKGDKLPCSGCGEGQGQGQDGASPGDQTGESGDRKPGSGKPKAANDDKDERQPQKGTGETKVRPETKIEKAADEDAWDLIEDLKRLEEMLEKGESPSKLVDQIEARINESRQKIAQIVQGLKLAGNERGSMLIDMSSDLPAPVIPWNKVLRRVITSGLGTRMDDSYTRFGAPTRGALAMGNRHVPFTPGTTIFTERPKVLVIVDVSGSNLANLPQIFSEIWSIAKKKNAIVEVMTFDCGVQQVITISSHRDFKKLMAEGVKGGGGTTLNGVFDEVSRMRDPYKSVVVMTDGYLSRPKKPKVGVVWLITHDGSDEAFKGPGGYGEIIHLPRPVIARKAA